MTNKSLADHRRSLAAAERGLIKARVELRAAVKREGLSTEGIFSETEFVLRTNANRWAVEAKHAAIDETIKIFETLRKVTDDPTMSPFAAYLEARRNSLRFVEQPEAPPAGKPILVVDNTTVVDTSAHEASPGNNAA